MGRLAKFWPIGIGGAREFAQIVAEVRIGKDAGLDLCGEHRARALKSSASLQSRILRRRDRGAICAVLCRPIEAASHRAAACGSLRRRMSGRHDKSRKRQKDERSGFHQAPAVLVNSAMCSAILIMSSIV